MIVLTEAEHLTRYKHCDSGFAIGMKAWNEKEKKKEKEKEILLELGQKWNRSGTSERLEETQGNTDPKTP